MKDEFKRLPKETLVDYAIRLGKMELSKEFYGINWTTIQKLMNEETGKTVNKDYWQRKIRAYLEVYENDQKKEIGIKKVEQKKLEELMERRKLQALRVDINKQQRENARSELISEQVAKSIIRMPTPKFQPLSSDLNSSLMSTTDCDGVLSFGDIHYGKKFKSLNNEYSCEIAKKRLQDLLNQTVVTVRSFGFDKIKILNLADNIEGMTLRSSQLTALQIGIVDQTIEFSKLMASWLNELSAYVEIEYIHVPSANHTEVRPFNSKRSEFPEEDFEKIIMNYIHDSLENNDRVTVPINPKGIVPFDIVGYNAVALHGHQLKNKKNAIKDLSFQYHKFFNYLFLGHFHHGEYITVGADKTANSEVIQVPSIMGSDAYSDSLGLSCKAGAAFDIFQHGAGRVLQYNITLN